MQLNSTFISNIQDVYGKVGELWLKELPNRVNVLCQKHDLRFIKVMPNLTYHFVGIVELVATNEPAMLKMAPTNINIIQEAKWLQSFDKAVAKVYWIDEEHHAFLMEQLIPGTSLKSWVTKNDDEATRIICRTIKDLQTHQIHTLPCKHLSELGKSLPKLSGYLESKMLSQAITLFDELTQNRQHDVLLHGDLHHDNILSSGSGWKAIDPHGYIGDPVFEVGPMIYNPGDCFPQHLPLAQVIDRRLNILSEELGFDSQRIKAWCFCMTVLSMAWTVEDHHYIPDFELEVAKTCLGLRS